MLLIQLLTNTRKIIKDVLYRLKSFYPIRKAVWKLYLERSYPKDIAIETTSICNRKCSYCPNSNNKRPHTYMDIELFKNIIRDLEKIGYSGKIYPLLYGEPLIDKRLPALMKYTKLKLPKCRIELATNGDFLSVPMVQLLFKSIDFLYISLHDPRPSNKLRSVLDYLQIDQKLKERYGMLNYFDGEIDLMNRDGSISDKRIRYVPRWGCDRAATSPVIAYNGDVLICCNDYAHSVVLGNCSGTDFRKIWFDSKGIRKNIFLGIYKHKLCKICAGIRDSDA